MIFLEKREKLSNLFKSNLYKSIFTGTIFKTFFQISLFLTFDTYNSKKDFVSLYIARDILIR